MKRLLSEPLVHFLLAGALLLGAVSIFGQDAATSAPRGEPSRRIAVAAESLRPFIQAKTGIEDEALFAARYGALDDVALREWIDRFVREEALVREARRLGLDQQDDLIRRRLVQQIEFVALGVVESNLEFGRDELEATYLERREDYRVPATLSFSHVFVAMKPAADQGEARARAKALLEDLNEGGADSAAALGRGDRFLYNRNYVNRTLDEIESHFGATMAADLSAREIDPSRWQGPFASPHGLHLVLLSKSEASRLPEIDEIENVLREDWRRSIRDAALDRAVGEIIAGYEIEIDEAISNRSALPGTQSAITSD